MSLFGSYQSLFQGASGGRSDPAGRPQAMGAWRLSAGNEGFRNSHLGPAAGQAASLPSDVAGVYTSDATHSILDGHRGAQVAGHTDAEFSSNTAATASHSFWANRLHLTKAFGYQGGETAYKSRAQEHLPNLNAESGEVPRSTLVTQRAARLSGTKEDQLLVKGPAEGHVRMRSFLTREWTGSELGMMGLGMYAAYSLLTRV